MNRCESTLALLDYEQVESDDCSSGYGSMPDLSDTEPITLIHTSDVEHVPLIKHSINIHIKSEKQECKPKEKMRYRNTQVLSEQLRIISSLPELCDVVFHVGPERTEVFGVKAILGTRSRVLYNLILKKQKEDEFQIEAQKKNRKNKRQAEPQTDKIKIIVKKYQPDDFRQIIGFIHCGSVDINSLNVAGLLCGASQFGLDDLGKACWDFVNHCIKKRNAGNLLHSAKRYKNFKVGQILLEKILCSVVRSVDV